MKKEKQLVIACSDKKVDQKILVSEFKSIFKNLKLDSPVDILIDIKSLNLEASVKDNERYTSFFLKEKINAKKIAVLTNTPSQVVQSMLLIEGVKHLGIAMKVFNSEKAGLDWINSNCQNKKTLQIHQALSKLSNKKAS
ncbi:hypothetical protein [Marinifilum sp. D714]|uniref:hypothetical protein n=1 Tax=Marinifilum sp. D714 TaxID=2937523 RepID=UPI0027CA6E2B|nr:hypothetical protein [Marinifilum sp. D714]MDQ2178107.1 hypothetical protein [Marinifilum sp. D714]